MVDLAGAGERVPLDPNAIDIIREDIASAALTAAKTAPVGLKDTPPPPPVGPGGGALLVTLLGRVDRIFFHFLVMGCMLNFKKRGF